MSTFTESQQQAINATGNVLVSAGAGTGKTGTVVARCLRLLIEEHCSIENILMVTFTEAAAAEMRARLRKELERRRDDLHNSASDGSDARNNPSAIETIEEQLTLLDTAQISTLHGFALQLVREHFAELGIDPQINVLDESQTHPLIHAALDALFEQCYEERSPFARAVIGLVRNYGGGSEEKIRGLVLKLHRYTQALPQPARWIAEQLERLSEAEPREWRELFIRAVCEWRAEFAEQLPAHKDCANIAACIRALDGCSGQLTFSQAADAVRCVAETFHMEWVRGTVGKHRDPLEKFFERALFLASLVSESEATDPLTEDWDRMREPMRALLELTRAFAADFTRAKRALGGVDFADIEQLALACLIDADGKPNATAEVWQQKFSHVFVDEYQDINAAQDAILRAVSRGQQPADDQDLFASPAPGNRFLVGDVKQSIYRFRLADPTIFRAYEEQWRAGGGGQRIPLADNFRSRERILDFVNPLFAQLMRPEIGGVHYDADAQLRFGNPSERQLLSAQTDSSPRVELNIIHDGDAPGEARNGDDTETEEAVELPDVDNVELEARLVARRLRELHDSRHLIWDTNEKRLRKVDWKDMVVLLRSPGPRIEGFAKEFSRAGIPLVAARAGFFSSIEVCDLLNVLRLLDNPLQDIPLVAVLRSPLFGFSADELAVIRAVVGRDGPFTAAFNRFAVKGSSSKPSGIEASAREKVRTFRGSFEKWRRLMRHSSLSQCLETILSDTHYEALLLAENRGRERTANVQRLLELARTYDPYQRQGLYRFLKFVSEQEESGFDHDVASVDSGNAVRLMSIHGSKGLEFPVVALACLAGQFNQTDLRQDILLSPALGLCAKIVCPKSERHYPSLPWWFAKQVEQRELLGEELRLLYVAMTRARDTLLLTALDSRRNGEEPWASGRTDAIDTRELLSARNYWDWIKNWLARATQSSDWESDHAGANNLLTWRRWTKGELANGEKGSVIAGEKGADTDAALDVEPLRQRLTWKYPFGPATTEIAKSNVSALRRRASELDDEARWLFTPRPRAGASAVLDAASLGSAHHAFLQRVNLQRTGSLIELRGEAERFVQDGWLTRADADSIDYQSLLRFWQSTDGRALAANPIQLHRELPFTAKFTVAQLRKLGLTHSEADDEFVIVQGVVDLAVIRPTDIDVLDFKTDRVTRASIAAKADEYAPQLRLYAAALGAIYRRPVRQAALHFLALGETLPISVREI